MTYESIPQPDDLNLYLFVKTSVQELRDDRSEAQPLAEETPPAELQEKSEQ